MNNNLSEIYDKYKDVLKESIIGRSRESTEDDFITQSNQEAFRGSYSQIRNFLYREEHRNDDDIYEYIRDKETKEKTLVSHFGFLEGQRDKNFGIIILKINKRLNDECSYQLSVGFDDGYFGSLFFFSLNDSDLIDSSPTNTYDSSPCFWCSLFFIEELEKFLDIFYQEFSSPEYTSKDLINNWSKEDSLEVMKKINRKYGKGLFKQIGYVKDGMG